MNEFDEINEEESYSTEEVVRKLEKQIQEGKDRYRKNRPRRIALRVLKTTIVISSVILGTLLLCLVFWKELNAPQDESFGVGIVFMWFAVCFAVWYCLMWITDKLLSILGALIPLKVCCLFKSTVNIGYTGLKNKFVKFTHFFSSILTNNINVFRVKLSTLFYDLFIFFNVLNIEKITQIVIIKLNKTYHDNICVIHNAQPFQSENDTNIKYAGDINPQKIKNTLIIISLLILGLAINLATFFLLLKTNFNVANTNEILPKNETILIMSILFIASIVAIISQTKRVLRFIKVIIKTPSNI